MAYLNLLRGQYPDNHPGDTEYPLAEDLEGFYSHLEQTLVKTNFIIAKHPGMVMAKLRRLYNRARPETQELNILRGILASVDKTIKNREK
jgi:tRNA (cytidine32/uridine32-2'-O)-methyltransferase